MKEKKDNQEKGAKQEPNEILLPENVSFKEIGRVMIEPSEEEEDPKKVIREDTHETDETKEQLIAAINRVEEMGKRTGEQLTGDEPESRLENKRNKRNKNMQTTLNYHPTNTKINDAQTQGTLNPKKTEEKERVDD